MDVLSTPADPLLDQQRLGYATLVERELTLGRQRKAFQQAVVEQRQQLEAAQTRLERAKTVAALPERP